MFKVSSNDVTTAITNRLVQVTVMNWQDLSGNQMIKHRSNNMEGIIREKFETKQKHQAVEIRFKSEAR